MVLTNFVSSLIKVMIFSPKFSLSSSDLPPVLVGEEEIITVEVDQVLVQVLAQVLVQVLAQVLVQALA